MLHMEQKNYKLEIIGLLMKCENHSREIARILEINHMTINRKIEELLKENVVDFKIMGKNKVFFLKQTIEARMYLLFSEQYKLIKILKKYPELRKIVGKIQQTKKISLAILFGSYAKGIANRNSDIDIYIKTKNKKIKKDLEIINSKLSIKIGILHEKNLLTKEIKKNGIIIKGFEKYYEN